MKQITFTIATLFFLVMSRPALGLELSLDEAMKRASVASVSLKIARSGVDEAKAKESQTLGAMGPRLEAEGLKAWNSKSTNKLVGQRINGTLVPETVTTGALVLSQPITPLYALLQKTNIDSTMASIAVREADQSEKDAKVAGAEAFLRALKAEQLLAIAKASLAVVEKQKRDADVLMRNGALSSADVLRFELALSDAKVQLLQAQNTHEIARASLTEVLGLSDKDEVVLAHANESYWERKKPQVEEMEKLVNEAVALRPEVLAAQERIQVAEYGVTATYADYFPVVAAFAKYERDFEAKDIASPEVRIPNGPVLSPAVSYKKEDYRDKLTYGLNLKWTIWDWNQRYRKTREISALAQKARYAAEGTQMKVRLEAKQSYLDFRMLVETLESSKLAARLAGEAYRQTELKFQNGTASTTDMITAERDNTRAKAGLANTRVDLDVAWLKLQKATGKELSIE